MTNLLNKSSTSPLLFLAPIAGFTHAAFRQLVAEIGGCSIFYTEMLNSRIVANRSIKDDIYLKKGVIDKPLIAQLVGNDPDIMAKAACFLKKDGFDGIDINMGCSRKAITKHGWGAALLNDTTTALKIVEAIRKEIKGFLSVKLRSPSGHQTGHLLNLCKDLESAGVDLIVLHPRAPEDGFKRPAVWDEIKLLSDKLDIPIIGNGDVVSYEDVSSMQQNTGCSGVMIGRAALIRPWIFWEAVHKTKWHGDVVCVIERAAALFQLYLPETIQTKHFIMFCAWLLRNWAFYHHLLKKLSTLKSVKECLVFLRQELNQDTLSLVDTPFIGRL